MVDTGHLNNIQKLNIFTDFKIEISIKRYEYGKISRDRGGESYFLTGKIGTKATDNLDFEMTLQTPLHQNLNESQLVSPFIIQFGSLYRFGT